MLWTTMKYQDLWSPPGLLFYGHVYGLPWNIRRPGGDHTSCLLFYCHVHGHDHRKIKTRGWPTSLDISIVMSMDMTIERSRPGGDPQVSWYLIVMSMDMTIERSRPGGDHTGLDISIVMFHGHDHRKIKTRGWPTSLDISIVMSINMTIERSRPVGWPTSLDISIVMFHGHDHRKIKTRGWPTSLLFYDHVMDYNEISRRVVTPWSPLLWSCLWITIERSRPGGDHKSWYPHCMVHVYGLHMKDQDQGVTHKSWYFYCHVHGHDHRKIKTRGWPTSLDISIVMSMDMTIERSRPGGDPQVLIFLLSCPWTTMTISRLVSHQGVSWLLWSCLWITMKYQDLWSPPGLLFYGHVSPLNMTISRLVSHQGVTHKSWYGHCSPLTMTISRLVSHQGVSSSMVMSWTTMKYQDLWSPPGLLFYGHCNPWTWP